MNQEQKIEGKLDEILSSVKNMEKDLGDTMRAVYGDEKNDVPGLLKRQAQDEKNIRILMGFRKKLIWISSAIITGLNLAWFVIKEFFMSK